MNIKDYPVVIDGEYVFTPCKNQFTGGSKVSYWISKQGYVYAAYVFSADDPGTAKDMLRKEYLKGYISLFDSMVDDRVLLDMYRADVGDTKDIELLIAKHLINEFCKKEYGTSADFTDLTDVGIAYTVTDDGLFDIQASVNLVNNVIFTKVDDKVVCSTIRSSLRDLITYELKYLSFDDLVRVEPEKLLPIYRRKLVGEDIILDNKVWTIKDIGAFVLLYDYSAVQRGPLIMRKDLETVASAYHQQEIEREQLKQKAEQSKKHICFKSVNIDGKELTWEFKNVSELEAAWLSEECDLPANDDKIYDIQIYNTKPTLITFEDLLRFLELITDMEE